MDTALLETLELLTPAEQKAAVAVAEFLKSHRVEQDQSDALDSELQSGELAFTTPDEGLSPARLAVRRCMRENPARMRLLAQ